MVELQQGVHVDYRLRAVLDAEWIERRAVDTDAGYAALARFAKRLVSRGRNIGETEVLALAETMPAIAVIDDGVAYKAAKKAKVRCTRTLALLCEAIHKDLLTVDFVSTITDDFLVAKYRLPFHPGQFARWAAENYVFAQEPGPLTNAGGTPPKP